MLLSKLEELSSIFKAYAASSLEGDATTMDLDELHDFVVETVRVCQPPPIFHTPQTKVSPWVGSHCGQMQPDADVVC